MSTIITMTLNSLCGRLLISLSSSSFSEVCLVLSLRTYSSFSAFCLTLCVCFYVLGRLIPSPGFEVVVYVKVVLWYTIKQPPLPCPPVSQDRFPRGVPCVSCMYPLLWMGWYGLADVQDCLWCGCLWVWPCVLWVHWWEHWPLCLRGLASSVASCYSAESHCWVALVWTEATHWAWWGEQVAWEGSWPRWEGWFGESARECWESASTLDGKVQKCLSPAIGQAQQREE